MKKINIWLIILGLLLIIIPYFINDYSILRLCSLLIGIIILSIGLIINFPVPIWRTILLPLLLVAGTYLLDYFTVNLYNNYPIMATKHKSSYKVITYNSLFYRLFSCDKEKILDNNYEKDYLCANDAIKTISVNDFLESPVTSFHNNKGLFVHLSGKITTIVGNSSLTLNAFEEQMDVNGYVIFDENKKIVIDNLKLEPTDFHIYDYIEVIGLVSSFKQNESSIEIHLTDARIIKTDLYDNYDLEVNTNNQTSKVQMQDKIYYLGIQNIYYRFDANNVYELDYLLVDKRETIENITKFASVTTFDNYVLFELDDYSLVKCANEDLIFVNKNINISDDICDK